jgi:hypothetical protein
MASNDSQNDKPPNDSNMSNGDRDYLQLQYQEGASTIRAFLDSRYKILEFIGFYNAAVLTFGFGQGIFASPDTTIGALLICILSALVSLMGLVTEFSLTSYNKIYYSVLRNIESKMGKTALPELGLFTRGQNAIKDYRFHSIMSVQRAHKLLYLLLLVFWIAFSIYEVTRLF